MEKYEQLREQLQNVGDTGSMQCFGDSMLPIIRSGSVLTFRKEESYKVGDIVFCQITLKMDRDRKVRWLINHLLGDEYNVDQHFQQVSDALIGKDLNDFTFNGQKYSIADEIDVYIDAHMIIKEEEGKFLIAAANTNYGINGWTDKIFGRVIGSYVEDGEEFFSDNEEYGNRVLNAYHPTI